MIEFHYETDFKLEDEKRYRDWINCVLDSETYLPGELNYIFCGDDYLLKINRKYLNHTGYTDIITFDYGSGKEVSGDVFISIDRLKENSYKFATDFQDELQRVMAHGVLHLIGYDDKTDSGIQEMREKEEEKMKMFHVEQ